MKALDPEVIGREVVTADLDIREGRFQRWLSLIAGLSSLLAGLEVSYEHYRGSYSNRVMYTPVILALAFSVGFFPEEKEQFENRYGKINPRAPEVIRTVEQTGHYFGASSLSHVPARYRGSEYVDWLRRWDVYHAMIAGVPCAAGVAAFNLVRPQSAKPFADDAQNLIRELIPHLRRVLQIHNRNETLGALFDAGKIALDALDAAVVIVDEEARILMASGQAEDLLSKQRGLAACGGKLRTTHASEASRLDKLVRSAALSERGNKIGYGGVMRIDVETGSEIAPSCSSFKRAG